MGIDPGIRIAGFCIIKQTNKETRLVDCGNVKLQSTKSIAERLSILYDFFSVMIVKKSVNVIALETPFLGRNAQNFLKLGYVRGIIYLLSHNHNLSIQEFAPREIKKTITGFGGAQKEQVARVITKLFVQLPKQQTFDTYDAIAVALCGLWKEDSYAKYSKC